MDDRVRYLIYFQGMEAADAGKAVDDLKRSLQAVDPGTEAKRIRTDRDAMDMGTVLEVILAAPAAVELAKGIANLFKGIENWLSRTHDSKVTVIRVDRTIIAENISAREAAALAIRHSTEAQEH